MSDVLPNVIHDLLGREGPPAPLTDGPFEDMLAAAASEYLTPLLTGNGNEAAFDFALFRAGVLAAVCGPVPAWVYLSDLRWGKGRPLAAIRYDVLGNLLVLAATEAGRLGVGERPLLMRGAMRLLPNDRLARREATARETAAWIGSRFEANGRAYPLGWIFRGSGVPPESPQPELPIGGCFGSCSGGTPEPRGA